MYLRPAKPIAGTSAVELYDGHHPAATIYADRSGVHIVCQQGYETADLEHQVREPSGVQVTVRRIER
jgi:hypothetical protein